MSIVLFVCLSVTNVFNAKCLTTMLVNHLLYPRNNYDFHNICVYNHLFGTTPFDLSLPEGTVQPLQILRYCHHYNDISCVNYQISNIINFFKTKVATPIGTVLGGGSYQTFYYNFLTRVYSIRCKWGFNALKNVCLLLS